MRVNLRNLQETLPSEPVVYIGTASFESRCLSVAQNIETSGLKKSYILQNQDYFTYVDKNTQMLAELLGPESKIIPVGTDSPTETADKLSQEIFQDMASIESGLCLIDITTFTHEQLLVLVKLLSLERPKVDVVFAYTGADEYSFNEENEKKWLSSGVSDVRSVLGYPGRLLPSRKLHLVVLVGFEHERARHVIELYEPAILSLGLGHPSQSVSDQHHKINKVFYDDLKYFVDALESSTISVKQFEFSCVDPLATKKMVLQQAAHYPNHNTIVCPMNTKLSTVGVSLAGLENEDIQLTYAQAVEYNVGGYATPSDYVTTIPLNDLEFSAI